MTLEGWTIIGAGLVLAGISITTRLTHLAKQHGEEEARGENRFATLRSKLDTMNQTNAKLFKEFAGMVDQQGRLGDKMRTLEERMKKLEEGIERVRKSMRP